MIFIERPETDPFFNIAAEEYIFKNFSEDVLMLWQSEASVIVGKHQNTLAEVNLDFINKHNIPVIRRISGGGTVFHGPGNLNYTLITTNQNREKLIDFHKFTKPVIDFLSTLDIKAEFEGKNNLKIANKKFSGNSAHVYKNKVLHHGTLLFNTDLKILNESIRPSFATVEDKSVQSVRATVGNIKEHLSYEMSVEEFKRAYKKFILKYYQIDEIEDITNSEKKSIQLLANEKYKTREWTFGYSPKYASVSTMEIGGQQTEVRLKVLKGIIKEASIEGQTDEINRIRRVLEKLTGLPHHPDDIDLYLRQMGENNSDLNLLKQLFF